MKVEVKIAGASYSGVPAVLLPLASGNGKARFCEVSDTTATAADVASGKVFYTADGEAATGTLTGGTGGASSLTPLKYIHFTGTQFIDTGIKPSAVAKYNGTSLTNYSAVLKFVKPTANGWQALWGARIGGGDTQAFGLITSDLKAVRYDFGVTDTNGSSTQLDLGGTWSTDPNIPMVLTAYSGMKHLLSVRPDGYPTIWQDMSLTHAGSFDNVDASIYIGAYHRQDNDSAIFLNNDLYVYGFELWNLQGPCGIFIPANYQGQDGMYDTVGGKFHSMNGTIMDVTAATSYDDYDGTAF